MIYPVVELISALMTIAVLYRFGMTWAALPALCFSWGLITLSVIDYQTQLLPDRITFGLLWLGLLASLWGDYSHPDQAILGVIIGYLFFWGIDILFKTVRKKEAIGQGDLKLFAMIGAWVGWPAQINVLLIAVPLALIISLLVIGLGKSSFRDRIAFGPYLAFGGWADSGVRPPNAGIEQLSDF